MGGRSARPLHAFEYSAEPYSVLFEGVVDFLDGREAFVDFELMKVREVCCKAGENKVSF
jgi:hypothetical protein